jgi:hypothetical protein
MTSYADVKESLEGASNDSFEVANVKYAACAKLAGCSFGVGCSRQGGRTGITNRCRDEVARRTL